MSEKSVIMAEDFQRYRALLSLGHEVAGISYIPKDWRPGIDHESFFARALWKLRLPLDAAGANAAIRKAVTLAAASATERYDIVWIEKGNTIHPSTLRFVHEKLPAAKIVSCSEDDMYATHNRSIWYTRCIPYYDIIFTTKTYNLEELKTLGAHRTALFIDAFDPKLHRPLVLTAEERARFGCDVGFVGTFENDRAEQMLFLAERGIRVVVWWVLAGELGKANIRIWW